MSSDQIRIRRICIEFARDTHGAKPTKQSGLIWKLPTETMAGALTGCPQDPSNTTVRPVRTPRPLSYGIEIALTLACWWAPNKPGH